MQIDDSVMNGQERISFRLRSLYSEYGYERYRMSKFEEYDLYSRNKDFLFSEGVITFTDTNGRLMALKPDVTLSIVKNRKDTPGMLQKLYYHENVYRVSAAADGFREQTQVGLECMGNVDGACIAEVLKLAAESLKLCSENFVLEISHVGILNAFVDAIAPDQSVKKAILECAGQKNLHGISRVCRDNGISEGAENALKEFISPDHKREITADLIISTVAEHFNLSVQDLKGSKRNSEIVQPRHMAMYLCRNMTNLSLHSIGDVLGKRDHSTIMHGIEKVDNDIKQYEDIRRTIDVLKNKINPSD